MCLRALGRRKVIRFDMDAPAQPRDPEYEAYLKRAERNQRFRCQDCGCFITKAQADDSWRWTDYGKEWEPTCPPGKGCMR